jgi:hypothetical protein
MPSKPHYPGESEEYPEYEPEDEEEEIIEDKEESFPELKEELEELKIKKAQIEAERELKKEKRGIQREIRKIKYAPVYETGEKIKEFSVDLGEKGKEVVEKFRGTPEERAERRERMKKSFEKITKAVDKPVAMEAKPDVIPEGVPETYENEEKKDTLADNNLMKEQPIDKLKQLISFGQPQQQQPSGGLSSLLPEFGKSESLGMDIFGRGHQASYDERQPEEVLSARRKMTISKPEKQVRKPESVESVQHEKGIETLIDIGHSGEKLDLGFGGKGELLEFGSGRPVEYDLRPTTLGVGVDKVFSGFGEGETRKPLNLGFGQGSNIFGGTESLSKDGVLNFVGINKRQDIFNRPQQPMPPEKVKPVKKIKKHKRKKKRRK